MTTVQYTIHGLIDILVDSCVNDSVIEQIDFQIGYFKTRGDQLSAPHQIIVKPYDDFAVDPALTFDAYQLSRGITGEILDDPERRIAIKKGQYGYTIYTDGGFLINLYIQLLLIEHGISLVHAAAVADEYGRVTLLPGSTGVGKTALSTYLVKRSNYRVLGDDIVGLTEQGECLSFPRSLVLKEYNRSLFPEVFQRLNIGTEQTAGNSTRLAALKLKRFVRENAPFVGVSRAILQWLGLRDKVAQLFRAPAKSPEHPSLPIEDVLGPGTVADQGNIDHIIFLQRYAGTKFRVDFMSEEALCRRMFAIILHEWVSVMGQFFAIGALEMVDLPAYFDRVAAITRSGIAGKKCEMLLIPDSASPDELWRYLSRYLDSTGAATGT